ncbi:MAG: hypothetical protein KGI47_03590 [Betaproteobacteria bacterium]|nr:hypothetical protein [Betaproteobacteria bacterium]MDE2622470.1 hypothetical protein [Betaproteobacteria bacterium]
MKNQHNPLINLRYWVLLNLVSVLGTNTGDLMVHLFRLAFGDQTRIFGLKHLGPFPILLVMFLLVYLLAQRSERPQESYFWALILIIRTAATNIADMLSDDLSFSLTAIFLLLGLPLLVYSLYWQSQRTKPISVPFVPETPWNYWAAMMFAGVLGTAAGDALWQAMGLSTAAAPLSIVTGVFVMTGYRSYLAVTALYWFGVLLARITGTAAGDWLAKSAERGGSGLNLYTATMVSAAVFVIVAIIWKTKRPIQIPPVVNLEPQEASS